MRPRRVLFFGEAVTLAHVARTLVLGESLLPDHEVTLALAPDAHRYVPPDRFRVARLDSIPASRFIDALAKGRPLYDEATLLRYVQDDLRLIDSVRPDLVVGDFRISLSASARLRQVPYLAVANAYWSPWYERPPPLPVLPWTRLVPLAIGQVLFAVARGPVMGAHTDPLNRVRVRYGLPPLARDLRRVYMDTDHVVYADVPELFPTPGAPKSHRHIGPILWSPPADLPAWWSEPLDGPSAYVTMGSSGDPTLLGSIVTALDAIGVRALVATAGAEFSPPAGSLARTCAYLPGVQAAQRADLIVCNGGSLTTQQALAAGKPVLGVASNMDQFFNMRAICESGAGLTVRADRATVRDIREAVRMLLENASFGDSTRRLSAVLGRYSAADLFRSTVEGILGSGTDGGPSHEKDPTEPDPGIRAPLLDGLRAGVGNQPPGA